jgi:hypothetical protein
MTRWARGRDVGIVHGLSIRISQYNDTNNTTAKNTTKNTTNNTTHSSERQFEIYNILHFTVDLRSNSGSC